MGENGAGKSTLIKVLTGVEEFETGEILIDGCDHAIVNRSPQEAQNRGNQYSVSGGQSLSEPDCGRESVYRT